MARKDDTPAPQGVHVVAVEVVIVVVVIVVVIVIVAVDDVDDVHDGADGDGGERHELERGYRGRRRRRWSLWRAVCKVFFHLFLPSRYFMVAIAKFDYTKIILKSQSRSHTDVQHRTMPF